MTKREFSLENEYPYNCSGPVRWIISHLMRYPLFPLAGILAAVLENGFYSFIQILISRGFDLITTPGWSTGQLLMLALSVMGSALGQGTTGLARNYSLEFLAQLY